MNTPSLSESSTTRGTTKHHADADAAWLALVAERVSTMRFGVVQITVHDSKVVQIERTERTRLEVARP
jgi:hypothetical protein